MLNCQESARWQDLNHTGGGDGVLDLLALCASLGWQSRSLFQEGRCCHSFLEIRSETKQIEIKILKRLTAYSGLIKSLHCAMLGRMRLI